MKNNYTPQGKVKSRTDALGVRVGDIERKPVLTALGKDGNPLPANAELVLCGNLTGKTAVDICINGEPRLEEQSLLNFTGGPVTASYSSSRGNITVEKRTSAPAVIRSYAFGWSVKAGSTVDGAADVKVTGLFDAAMTSGWYRFEVAAGTLSIARPQKAPDGLAGIDVGLRLDCVVEWIDSKGTVVHTQRVPNQSYVPLGSEVRSVGNPTSSRSYYERLTPFTRTSDYVFINNPGGVEKYSYRVITKVYSPTGAIKNQYDFYIRPVLARATPTLTD